MKTVWRWSLISEAVSLGMLPVEQRAFKSIGAENMAPVKPFVLMDNGSPVVVFKQHRFAGFRAFGWDLFWCRREGNRWRAPERISPATTVSDAGFGLVRHGEGLLRVLGADFRGVGARYTGPRLHEDIPERGVQVDNWGIHRRWTGMPRAAPGVRPER